MEAHQADLEWILTRQTDSDSDVVLNLHGPLKGSKITKLKRFLSNLSGLSKGSAAVDL